MPANLHNLDELDTLDLSGNTISGSIPTDLGSLTSLTSLDLSVNGLSGSIPTELGGLTSLASLDLSVNGLSGSIPTELGSLTSLTSLDLSDNSLGNSIPTELGSLTSLASLDLSDNNLRGPIPTELGSLTNLTSLDLSVNGLSGSIPTELGNLSSLASLDLNYNFLDGSIPAVLGSLTNLTYLDLSDNGLSGSIPTELGNLSSLASLDLNYNFLDGSIPTELGSLTNLTYLDLSNNGLSGSIPTELGNLSSLASLDLNYNFLDGSIPTELGSLTNLTYLDLTVNSLSGSIPTELGGLTNLTYLDLNYNFLDGSIPTELGSLTSLTYLDLRYNNLTGEIPGAFSNLSNLTSLYLSGNSLSGCISETLPYTSDNDLDSLGLPVCITVTNDVPDPVLGQSVTLTAAANGPAGSILTYQWQEYTSGAWTNLSSTSTTLSVSSNTEALRTFKVVVSSGGTVWEESAPVNVQWRPVSVYIDMGDDLFPDPADDVTLTAVTDAPTGVALTYMWQQRSGDAWTNLTSTNNIQTVSADEEETNGQTVHVRGTKKYRVEVSYNNNAPSSETYVTWGEMSIVIDMLRALHSKMLEDMMYIGAEESLVTCMNRGRAEADHYTGFNDILADYTDATRAKMEGEGTCNSEATAIFNRFQSLSRSKLVELRNENAEYSALLNTIRGRDFESNVDDIAALKLYARLLSHNAPERSGSASGQGGAGGTDHPAQRAGFECITPYEGQEPPLNRKFEVLNCLVFNTSHGFWANKDNTNKLINRIDNQYLGADGQRVGPIDWLSYGGGDVCSNWFDGPSPSCIKHDFMWGSLKKFSDMGSEDQPDETWNPKNKHLSDQVLAANIERYGCQNPSDLADEAWCDVPHTFQSWIMSWAVASFAPGHLGWPITTRDLKDAESYPRFKSCNVPTISGVGVNTDRVGITLSWNYEPGCAVKHAKVEYEIVFFVLWHDGVSRPTQTKTRTHNSCTSCSYRFEYQAEFVPGDTIDGVVISIIPGDREHGGISYPTQRFSLDPFRVLY